MACNQGESKTSNEMQNLTKTTCLHLVTLEVDSYYFVTISFQNGVINYLKHTINSALQKA